MAFYFSGNGVARIEAEAQVLRGARVTIPECYALMAYCENAMLTAFDSVVFDNLRAVNQGAYTLILEDKMQHGEDMSAFWDSFSEA